MTSKKCQHIKFTVKFTGAVFSVLVALRWWIHYCPISVQQNGPVPSPCTVSSKSRTFWYVVLLSFFILFYFIKRRCWSWVLDVWILSFDISLSLFSIPLPFLSPIRYFFVLLSCCIVVEWKVWKYWIRLITMAHSCHNYDLEPNASPFIPLLWFTGCNFPFSYNWTDAVAPVGTTYCWGLLGDLFSTSSL